MTVDPNDAIPWYTWATVHWLESWLRPDMRVFEWGSGGSTLFFAARCAQVISVEHDRELVPPLFQRLQASGLHHKVTFHICPPDDYYLPEYESQDPHYASTHNFKHYASAIDQYPDGHFNFVAVDGRARPACIKHAIPKVAPNGVLLLDNAERYYYTAGVDLIPADWTMVCMYDHGPGNWYRWLTNIWLRES